MLTILEAAAPRLHLVDQLPSIVIPVDTVRALYNEKDFVTNIQFRPSVYRQFDTRLQRLSASDARWLKKIVAAKDAGQVAGAPVEVLSDANKVDILDTALDYIDYEKSKELRDGDAGALAWKQNVLQARSAILKPSRELAPPYPKGDEPHAGHHSRRVGLGVTANSAGGAQVVAKYRFALHDLLDATPGYPQGGQLEFFGEKDWTRVRIREHGLRIWRFSGWNRSIP